MTIHKEGYTILTITTLLLAAINGVTYYFFHDQLVVIGAVTFLSLIFFLLILQFFRSPKRDQTIGERLIIAPCDGKVVVIEQTIETEYYKETRLQVSIFMSPVNVHINWYPLSGIVKYLNHEAESRKAIRFMGAPFPSTQSR
jgi:phosphatidylserine decarboxylase